LNEQGQDKGVKLQLADHQVQEYHRMWVCISDLHMFCLRRRSSLPLMFMFLEIRYI
jgi:hypothetical protein